MTRLLRWLRVALLDLRGDLRRFTVLIACLALGVSTIAVVGSVGASLQAALARDARSVLGGDLEARLSYREATPEERALFDSFGRVTHMVEVLGNGEGGESSVFLSIRAVDDVYPLIGSVPVNDANGESLSQLLTPVDGVPGVVVDPLLLERLGIAEGDELKVGAGTFQIRGTLGKLPDQVTNGIQIGLQVIIGVDSLASTGIIEPGVLARYTYKVLFNPGIDFDTAKARIETQFADAGWLVRAPSDATEDLARFFDIFSRFLTIVGLSALLVGGVGVSNAVSAYVTERQRSIATLRALGATSQRIMVHFLAQVMSLTVIGILCGIVLGIIITLIALPVIGSLLSIALPPTIDPGSLALAGAFGLLIGFAFGFLPLKRAETLKPAILFRSSGTAVEGGLRWRDYLRPGLWLPLLVALGLTFGLAVWTTGRPLVVVWYALGVIGAFAVLRAAAFLLQRLLKLLPPLPGANLRNALKAVYRPGSPAPVVIMSLGLGLSLLLVIALIDGNLRGQLGATVSRDAPSFVFMDLFEDEADELRTYAESDPRIASFSATPMLRADITAINNVPIAQAGPFPDTVSFLFEGEAPITYAAAQPMPSEVVEGAWWPEDVTGEAQISVYKGFKEPLKLEIGSTMSFTIYGQQVVARVTNFRDFDWRGGGVNFALVLSPNAVGDAPVSQLGMLKTVEGQETAVQSALVKDFPDLLFLPIGDAIEAIAGILESVSNAVALIGGLAVVSGLFVLAGAMAAGRKQREADAVVMKVLGATRGDVLRAFLIEYGVLGALAAIFAAILGGVGAWAFVTQVLEFEFNADLLVIIGVILAAVLLTIAVGAVVTWSALSTKPAKFLRTEG